MYIGACIKQEVYARCVQAHCIGVVYKFGLFTVYVGYDDGQADVYDINGNW